MSSEGEPQAAPAAPAEEQKTEAVPAVAPAEQPAAPAGDAPAAAAASGEQGSGAAPAAAAAAEPRLPVRAYLEQTGEPSRPLTGAVAGHGGDPGCMCAARPLRAPESCRAAAAHPMRLPSCRVPSRSGAGADAGHDGAQPQAAGRPHRIPVHLPARPQPRQEAKGVSARAAPAIASSLCRPVPRHRIALSCCIASHVTGCARPPPLLPSPCAPSILPP